MFDFIFHSSLHFFRVCYVYLKQLIFGQYVQKKKSCLNNWAILNEMQWKVKHDQMEG